MYARIPFAATAALLSAAVSAAFGAAPAAATPALAEPLFTIADGQPAAGHLDVAGGPARQALAVWEAPGPEVRGRVVGRDRSPVGQVLTLAADGARPTVAHTAGRYAVAYAAADGVHAKQLHDRTHVRIVDPAADGTATLVGPGRDPDLTAHAGGFLLAFDEGGTIKVKRVGDAAAPVAVATGGAEPAVASNGDSALVVWTADSGRKQDGSPVREVYGRLLDGATLQPTGPARRLTDSPEADVRQPGVAVNLGALAPSVAWNAKARRWAFGHLVIPYTPEFRDCFGGCKLAYDLVAQQIKPDLTVTAPVRFYGSSYTTEDDPFGTSTAVDPRTGIGVSVTDGQPFATVAILPDGRAGLQDAVVIPESRKGVSVAAVPGSTRLLGVFADTGGSVRGRFFRSDRRIDSFGPAIRLRVPARNTLVLKCEERCAMTPSRTVVVCAPFSYDGEACIVSRRIRATKITRRDAKTVIVRFRQPTTRGRRLRDGEACFGMRVKAADRAGNRINAEAVGCQAASR